MTVYGSGSMKILFLAETRKNFSGAGGEGNAKVVGQFDAYDIRLTEAFRTPTTATLTISASQKWFSENLVPTSRPGLAVGRYRRACYVTFTGPSSAKVVLRVVSASIDLTQKKYEGNFTNVTIEAADPRIYFQVMPSDLTNPPSRYSGTVQGLLMELSKRCSNSDFSGKQAWQKLPITALSTFSPNAVQAAYGIVATSTLPTTSIGFDLSDPNPPEDDIQAALTLAGRDFELYPLLTHGADGTDSPWWRWVVRKRQTLPETLSDEAGAVTVNSFSSNLLVNESLFYDEESKTYAMGNGNSPQIPGHYGPWMGVEMNSATPPKGAEVKKWLQRRARAGTKGMKNVEVDLTVNSKALSIKHMTAGTYVRFSLSGAVFHLAVDEITWSYDYKQGDWTLDDWSL